MLLQTPLFSRWSLPLMMIKMSSPAIKNIRSEKLPETERFQKRTVCRKLHITIQIFVLSNMSFAGSKVRICVIENSRAKYEKKINSGTWVKLVKGSLTWDFRVQVFFMNQFTQAPLSIPLGPLRIFTKIHADIRNFVCLPVFKTPAINYRWCRWGKIIAGVVDTGDLPLLPSISANFCKIRRENL